MNPLFEVHMLNEEGKAKAKLLAEHFDELLSRIEQVCGMPPSGTTREMAIVKTKLEESCFYAKKYLAMRPENQQ